MIVVVISTKIERGFRKLFALREKEFLKFQATFIIASTDGSDLFIHNSAKCSYAFLPHAGDTLLGDAWLSLFLYVGKAIWPEVTRHGAI